MPTARHLLILRLARVAYSGARRVAARTSHRLAAFAVIALLTAWPLLATANSMNEFRDAQVLAHYEITARESVLRWHQAPLWDPYYCGGMYLLGTPQSRFVSPTFLLTLLFGETRAESLAIFVMIVVGLEGAFRYARSRKATALGAMLTAPVFALSGLFAVSSSLGWVGFYGFELLPWIALGMRRALAGEPMAVVTLALAAAFCVGFGGTYAAPIAALWCAFEVVEHAVVRRRHARRLFAELGVASVGVILAVGLAGVRLLPVAETLSAAPRIIGGAPGSTGISVALMLLWPTGGQNDHGLFYVGILVVPAVLLGLSRWRRNAGAIVAGVLCLWIATGYRAHPSLFAAMRHLPVYATLRYPERFLTPFALVLSWLGARGISFAQAFSRAPRQLSSPPTAASPQQFVLALAAVTSVCNLGPLISQHWARDFGRGTTAAPLQAHPPPPFRQARGNRWALDYYEPMERGSLSCWDAYPVPQSPLLRGDLAAEEYLGDPGAGTVARRSWSPNAIDLQVRLARPGTVVVNQNWHPGWRTNIGQVKSDHGILNVALPAGDHALSLRFAPRSATMGSLVSVVALAGLVVLWLHARRAPRANKRSTAIVLAAVATAPIVPLVATLTFAHDARQVVEPIAADGGSIVVDHVGKGAVLLETKFEEGLVLEATRLSNPNPQAGTDVIVELDWRRGVQTPRGVGVFVHIQPSKGDTLNADHVLLSGEIDFEDAPAFATVRDVFPVHVPADSHGKTWKVWVGLWMVRYGDQRLRVIDSGNAIVDKDRVLVATYQAR